MGYFQRREESWTSANLGMDMPIARYGLWGQPILVFPTAGEDFTEWEQRGMVEALRPVINEGLVKLYCINTLNAETWLNEEVSADECVRWQNHYDRYLSEEVIAYIRHDCRNNSQRVACAGIQFGAFHAFNTLCRHPDQFESVLALSGFFDLSPYAQGCHHQDYYFHNPSLYLPNLSDNYYLPTLQNNCRIVLISGQGAWETPEQSLRLSSLLSQKQIPHDIELWGSDIDHDWDSWRMMIQYLVPQFLRAQSTDRQRSAG